MLSYVARRLLYSVPALFVATFGLFWAVRSTFDPAAKFTASRDPTALARFKAKWGLDDPIPTQYWRWLKNFLQGDWGISTATNDNVSSMIWRSFGVTLQLIIWGMLFAAVVSMALGVFSAVRQYSAADYALTGLSYVGIAVPPFVFGLLAIQVLGVMLKNWLGLDAPLFPFVGLHTGNSSGFNLDYLRHLVLPVLTLTVQIVASWSRFQRAAMLDVMSSDYVRTARAKGVPRRQVVLRHGFRNALIPLVTGFPAAFIGAFFAGSVLIETLFSLDGLGLLSYESVIRRDYPVVFAILFVLTLIGLIAHLIRDLSYLWVDPRVKFD